MKPDSSRIQTKRPTGASASLRVSASGSKGGGSFKVKPPTEVKASFEKSPVKTEPSFETEPSLEKIPDSAPTASTHFAAFWAILPPSVSPRISPRRRCLS